MALMVYSFLLRGTAFLAAALMFSVQLMLGKMLLPLVGGTPGGWLTALVFFQMALLAGYAISAGLSSLPPWRYMALTQVLLAVGVGFMPHEVLPLLASWPQVLRVVAMLGLACFIPFLALSMMSGAVQRLAALQSGNGAYRLYAWSNAGSFAGLLFYPLLLEPFIPLSLQAKGWGVVYALLGLMGGGLLWLTHQQKTMQIASPFIETRADRRQKLYIMLLAAVPSALSFALTTLVTTVYGGMAVFWVLPLALYLLSLILAFGRVGQVRSGGVAGALLLTLLVSTGVEYESSLTLLPMVLALLAFFLMALALHIRLAACKPEANQLTGFYLAVAMGGCLGSLLMLLVVPLLLPWPVEFFVLMPLGALLVTRHRYEVGAVVVIGALAVLQPVLNIRENLVEIRRNFYGVAAVYDDTQPQGTVLRRLMTGPDVQGQQTLGGNRPLHEEDYWPPITAIMANPARREIGMIGFGVGMTLCLESAGRRYTVYEIDPKFRDMGERLFSYVKNCGSPRWRMGDGRLLLQQDVAALPSGERLYDVLIIDAFQSQQMPLHLMTQEAMQLYRRSLKPDGLLIYNLSNRYYALAPQIAAQAELSGGQVWLYPYIEWMVVARFDQNLSWLEAAGWHLYAERDKQIWRDDHTYPFAALRPWHEIF